MPNIVMEGYYSAPKYTPKTYTPPKPKTYTPQYREEPYDNSGAYDAAKRAQLIRDAQVEQARQLAIQKHAEAVAFAQKQAAIDKAQQSRTSRWGGLSDDDMKNAWNSYTGATGQNWNTVKSAIPLMGSALGNAWNKVVQNRNNANFEMTNLMNSIFGWQTMESWQRPGAQTGTTYYPGYQGGYPGARANFPNYNVNVAPGAAEDWGMTQMGNTANMMASGWQDQANWGRGVPTWEEVLRYADPNAHDPYDVAGNPYFTAQDMPIEDYYGDGYGGYGGGGNYSSKPGYYGQSSNYGNRYYENLLQWNI